LGNHTSVVILVVSEVSFSYYRQRPLHVFKNPLLFVVCKCLHTYHKKSWSIQYILSRKWVGVLDTLYVLWFRLSSRSKYQRLLCRPSLSVRLWHISDGTV